MSTDVSGVNLPLPVVGLPVRRRNRRAAKLWLAAISLVLLLAVVVGAPLLGDAGLRLDLAARTLAPSWQHLFGTDAVGRDMFCRTIKGLSLSLWVGLLASGASTIISLSLALAAVSLGRIADAAVGVLVDMFMGLPHLVLLVMICFALGGGTHAVIVAVALTHWPRLTRILRAEILQVLTSDYVAASRRFGRSAAFVAWRHLIPHVVPQLLVGFLLLFPHAILHEAGLTFLGFGIEPSKPAVGVLLAESMRYLTAGDWWLGVFPGVALVTIVLAFDGLADGVRALFSPHAAQD
ncbi:MAG TPA: ABC transporter permease [Xanthobacteraceae bacterium]|nr:ABC transporter permease [Xanthobacteraceae bacterium]